MLDETAFKNVESCDNSSTNHSKNSLEKILPITWGIFSHSLKAGRQPGPVGQIYFRAGQAKGPRNLWCPKLCSHPFPQIHDLPDAVLQLIPIQTLLMCCEMIPLEQHKHLVFSLDWWVLNHRA